MPASPPIYEIIGGYQTFTAYSGAATDVGITSGGGRLNQFQLNNYLGSGFPIIFYDAAVPGGTTGPIPGSGHKILYSFPQVAFQSGFPTQASGQNPGMITGPMPVQVNMPFSSGLNVHQVSGGAAWCCSFSFEKPQL